jgi:glycerophosphoryl diester phosphodiesterase
MLSAVMRNITLLLAAAASSVLAACQTGPTGNWPHASLDNARPLVIAHRGASGLRPEHTIAAYTLALEQGADCIEPDLVMTKDGVLVARHDVYLSSTTNIADHPEFAARRRTLEGREDWFAADFTLAELKTLRARQAFPGRSTDHDGQHAIPTFEEVIDLALANRTAAGDPVCLYPEAKAPALHTTLGLDMGTEILRVLTAKGLNRADAPVFIQSFEPPFVKDMNSRTQIPVVMLTGSRAEYDAAMAAEGAPFWDGLGAAIPLLFNADGSSSGIVEAAHAKGIAVHPWTFRDDAPFRDAPFNGEAADKSMQRTLALGVDGFFTDFPATGVNVVDAIAPRD